MDFEPQVSPGGSYSGRLGNDFQELLGHHIWLIVFKEQDSLVCSI